MASEETAVRSVVSELTAGNEAEKRERSSASLHRNLVLCEKVAANSGGSELARVLLRESDPSVESLEFASWLVAKERLSKEEVGAFVKETVEKLCGEGREEEWKHVVKCVCVFVVGLCRMKRLEESVGEERGGEV